MRATFFRLGRGNLPYFFASLKGDALTMLFGNASRNDIRRSPNECAIAA
jgi:hypothetical protein